MSHTPGPWRVHSEVPNRIILNGSACYEVVDLVRMEQYHNYADMRLIAAAPELLDACHAVANDLRRLLDGDDFSGMTDNDLFGAFLGTLNAAISKADGRHHADA
jgi:hypothetical protein